jgi:phosphoglycerol transferase MdoB-like AlkP superfamily enzyme
MNRSPGARAPQGVLVLAALASWPVPFYCYALHAGTRAAGRAALAILLAVGAISLILRLSRRAGAPFGLLFPAGGGQRGTPFSIRLNAVLLAVFNLGASWFELRTNLSHTTMLLVLILSTVSTANLADESWIARRRT